ncbi:hypothetical protein E2C01_017887 [Portunus trituberculatus]|uniref:Uncharacterized protein n=1 Tax=Portunus trituberculatus TaxID=210409 RepID=A0A5B7DV12_PORTR|nr:hypothetical protein [Portunus trituberculatus]
MRATNKFRGRTIRAEGERMRAANPQAGVPRDTGQRFVRQFISREAKSARNSSIGVGVWATGLVDGRVQEEMEGKRAEMFVAPLEAATFLGRAVEEELSQE